MMNSNSYTRAVFIVLPILMVLVLNPSVALGINGDAFPDAVFASTSNVQSNRVCLGDGTGGFTCNDVSGETSNSSERVALGDVDGDGNLDAVFANLGKNRVCLGDGGGGFNPCSDVSSNTDTSRDVALGDVDGDGNLDAVFANSFQENRVCLGNGAGGFTCGNVSAEKKQSQAVALGDVDGNGTLDAVFGIFSLHNQVCLGDGAGGFTCSDMNTDSNLTRDVALGDVDGNGTLDAVFANDDALPATPPQRNRVCLGDGAGGFTCNDVSTDENGSLGAALGDVDGNGTLDAVFANRTGGVFPSGKENRVCLGDGAGSFTCSDVSTDANHSFGMALGDVDGNGTLDAVFANFFNTPDRVCLGDGAGSFTCSDVSADLTSSFGVALTSRINGTVNGLASKVICKNKTSGQKVKKPFTPPNWDCGVLSTTSGDPVVVTLKGKSDGSAITGTLEGLDPVNRVKCINKTTLAKARGTVSLPNWDCGSLPLPTSGDRIRVKIKGSAE